MEIVAEYQGKCTPDIFARVLSETGREYNNCMIVVENNTVGFAVLDKLNDFEYPNIYYSIKSTHEYVDQYTAEYKSNAVAGFTTSNKTRPLIIAKMEEFIRNKLINIRSLRLYNEMKTFVWNNGRAQAMRSYNDDLVMACAIGCWIRDTIFAENQRDAEYKKSMIDSMISAKTMLNTTIPGMAGYNKKQKMIDVKIEERKKMIEHAWLYKG